MDRASWVPGGSSGLGWGGGGFSGQPSLSELATAGQSVLPYCQEHPGLHLLPGSPRSRLSQEGRTLGLGGTLASGVLASLSFLHAP